MASVTYPKVLAFKPETIITTMPRASKSTGARVLKKKVLKRNYRSRAEKTRRILERKSSEKEKRRLRMLIKNFIP